MGEFKSRGRALQAVWLVWMQGVNRECFWRLAQQAMQGKAGAVLHAVQGGQSQMVRSWRNLGSWRSLWNMEALLLLFARQPAILQDIAASSEADTKLDYTWDAEHLELLGGSWIPTPSASTV